MIKTLYKLLVAIALAIYDFIFFIMLALLGFCSDSNDCTTQIYSIQFTLLAYGILQWVLYFIAIKRNNSRLLLALVVSPLALIGLYTIYLYSLPSGT